MSPLRQEGGHMKKEAPAKKELVSKKATRGHAFVLSSVSRGFPFRDALMSFCSIVGQSLIVHLKKRYVLGIWPLPVYVLSALARPGFCHLEGAFDPNLAARCLEERSEHSTQSQSG